MNILIENDIFENANTHDEQLELLHLLYLIWDRHRYTLMLNADVQNCQSIKDWSDNDKEILNGCFIKSVVESLNADCIISKDGTNIYDEKIFTTAEGVKYLSQPLSIIVENSLNDAHFVRAIMRCYDSSGILLVHDQEYWLKFENAGGCTNVINFIEGCINQYGKPKFLKCFVLLDGDKYYAGETQTKYDTLKEKLDSWNINYHILEKRCMENYMPVRAIPDTQTSHQWKLAYMSLSPKQRDFINIGEGFYGDLTVCQKQELADKEKLKGGIIRFFRNGDIEDFYSSVSDGNFNHLCRGIGISNYKTEFPKYFDDTDNVNKIAFDELTAHQENRNELKDIVVTLRSLI